MKTAVSTPRSAPAAVLVVAALFLSLVWARPAGAWVDSGWGYGSGYYDSWDNGESQAWAEEQSRESAREKRRDELEKKQEAASAEHAAYTAEMIKASKASLNAPKDVYYRKPGWTSSDAPPATAQTVGVEVQGGMISVIYDQGVFWLQRGNDYVVVVPPFGVVVDKLPPGVRNQPVKGGGMLYYFFGVFFQAKGDKYEVVKPPAGTFVGYLPDGYTQEGSETEPVFKFGATAFKQVFVAGNVAYQVI
jgi:hypothetical protein